MRQFQSCYENKDDFAKWLKSIKTTYETTPYSDIVFYITWIKSTEIVLDIVTDEIEKQFPNAIYYGNEASGSIASGNLLYGINITCYLFKKESSKAELVWVEKGTELSTLDDLWAYCNKKEGLKAVELIPSISYLETLSIDNNVPSISNDIFIFGGASVNYNDATFDAAIVAKGHKKTRDGMAVILYFGEDLQFYAKDIIGWKGLGRLLEVTDSTGKVIKEIEHEPAFSIYEKYLDLSVDDTDALVFPLILDDNGNEFIRTPQIINEDKSMSMFASVPTGSKVRIAYGDKNTILESLYDAASSIAKFNPEAIKAFSCAARRLFWGNDEISKETKILEDIAPVCGFYTGGEIMRFNGKIKVLNQTLAIVAVRETGAEEAVKETPHSKRSFDTSLLSRLTFFSEKIVKEERAQRELAEGLENAFASQYSVLYFVDVKHDKATLIRGDEEASKFFSLSDGEAPEELYKNFKEKYVNKIVVEEDIEKVISTMNPTNALSTLRNTNNISVNYRVRRLDNNDVSYIEMRMIKAGEENGEVTSIILAFRLTDKEFVDVLEQNERLQKEILDEMLGDDGLFLIDCKNNTRTTLHDNLQNSAQFSDEIAYSNAFSEYVNRFVSPVDRDMMAKFIDPKYLLEMVKDKKHFSVEYMDCSEGKLFFYEMRIRSFSDTQVLQSFAKKDKEILDRMILDKVEEDYAAMFSINLDTGFVKTQKNALWDQGEDFGKVTTYEDTINSLSFIFEGHMDDFYHTIADIDIIKDRFKDVDRATHVFKTTIDNEERWVNIVGRVLSRHEDNTPYIFALGFEYLDEEASETQEAHAKVLEQQKELEIAKKAADAANEAKTNFLFSMSHDIRTPMNAISGFTALAKKYYTDETRVKDYINKIDISTKQLLALINKVLEMSRIEAGVVELEEVPANVVDRYNAMVTVLAAQAQLKGLEFHAKLGTIKHNYVYADDERLGQITYNIAGNAIKYTPEGGKVFFNFSEVPSRKEGYASYTLTVEDTGIGMSEEFQKHLFETFAREKSSTVSKIQGTGLGMPIVKQLVDLMDGEIKVESKLGVGTRFDVTIDLKYCGENESDDIDTKFVDISSFKDKRVLLVEDNEMNREIAKDILKDYGFIIEEATDGDVAVEMVKSHVKKLEYTYYDLILMDIQMPRMNGYEATKAIRSIPSPKKTHIPIIAVTANAFDEDVLKAKEAGMDAHLAKPISVHSLLSLLSKF